MFKVTKDRNNSIVRCDEIIPLSIKIVIKGIIPLLLFVMPTLGWTDLKTQNL